MTRHAEGKVWLIVLAAAMACGSGAVRGEANEIRLAKQFSMGYVQFNILDHRHLIEKHAKIRGLGDVKVTWVTFNGPDAMNTALLSSQVDVVAGGGPALLT